MDLGHRDARVIVTGGGANIGRGIALGLAAEGARVLVADIDGPQAEAVAAEARRAGAADAQFAAADLTAPDAAAGVAGRAVSAWGGVDVLVNNAGWSKPGFFADQTDRRLWQRTVEVNLYTAIACTQAVLGPMREAGGGAVVFISSDSAFGAIRQGIYGSTKAGLISLARTVAREHGRHGIRSNVVAPGLVVPDDDAPAGSHSGRPGRDLHAGTGRLRAQPAAAAPDDHGRRHRQRGRVDLLAAGGTAGDRPGRRRRRRLDDAPEARTSVRSD